jgi:hypothetical protein
MIKSFAAFAIFSILGASVITLPGFAPPVKADEAVVNAKADRLPLHSEAGACSDQVWPNFDASCLHGGSTSLLVRETRLVPTRR